MKIRWTAVLTVLVFAVITIPAFAQTLEATKSPLAIIGPGRIVANGEDLVVTLEDGKLVTEVTILGGAWLNPVRTEGRIVVEYSEDLAVAVDDVPVVSVGKDSASIGGIRVIRFDKNLPFRDAAPHDPISPETDPDLITCGEGGVVTADDECEVGGPGSISATYRCGFLNFGVDTAIACGAGYYACVTGCGFGNCRNMACAPCPPAKG